MSNHFVNGQSLIQFCLMDRSALALAVWASQALMLFVGSACGTSNEVEPGCGVDSYAANPSADTVSVAPGAASQSSARPSVPVVASASPNTARAPETGRPSGSNAVTETQSRAPSGVAASEHRTPASNNAVPRGLENLNLRL